MVLTATYYDDQRGFDDVEPGYFDDTAQGAVPAAGKPTFQRPALAAKWPAQAKRIRALTRS